jgi:tetratricopeptide (TPR) repeat protein
VGDRGGEASTLNNIGLVYHAWGEMDKALQYYQQALPLQRAVGDRSGEAVTCFNMAMVYRNLGQLEKAVAFLERCVELDEQIRHPDLESDRAMLQRVRAELAHQGN